MARACLFFLIAGAWALHAGHTGGVAGMPSVLYGPVSLLTAGLLSLVMATTCLLRIILGLPRLRIGTQGIAQTSLFATRSITWDRLGPFTVVQARGWRGGKPRSASAPVQGGKRRQFVIMDRFAVPLTDLLQEIAIRRGAAGFAPAMPPPRRQVGVDGFRWPWLTTLLLAIFVAVFIVEQRFGIAPAGKGGTPAPGTLLALGGLSAPAIRAGEWYRMLTAPFLHASAGHLVANAIAFGMAGWALERLLGRAWMFSIFAAGALAGSLVSLAMAAPATVSVGASGAIMAMLVALFAVSFRMPAGGIRLQIQIQSLRVAVPALLPFAHDTGAPIDYGAHFGGALLGGVFGLLLLASWGAEARLPRFRTGAAVFAGVAAMGFGISAMAVAKSYPAHAAAGSAQLADWIPPAEYPHGNAEIAAVADSLVARYPRDPRAHYLAGTALLLRKDEAGAESQFRAALAIAATAPVAPLMRATLHGLLGLIIEDAGRMQEAREMAADACHATGAAVPPAQLMQLLAKGGLCSGT